MSSINGPFEKFEQVENHRNFLDSTVIWTKTPDGMNFKYIMIKNCDVYKIQRLEFLKKKASVPRFLPVPIKMENFGFLACALRCILTESDHFHPDTESMARWLKTTD
jgi:hypothetical protein